MDKILQKANLIWTGAIGSVAIGVISRGLKGMKTIYAIDLDPQKVEEVLKYDVSNLCTLIPGLDIEEDGYYVEYQQPPFIVEMRVPDRRRNDINEIAEKHGMDYYDEFTYFLITKGYVGDEWSVEPIGVS
jgi:hypothetical protein